MNRPAVLLLLAGAFLGGCSSLPTQAEIDAMNAQIDTEIANVGNDPTWTPAGLNAALDVLLKNAARPVSANEPYFWGDVPGMRRISGSGFGDCTSVPDGVVCYSRWRRDPAAGRAYVPALEAELRRRLPTWAVNRRPLKLGETLSETEGWEGETTEFAPPAGDRSIRLFSMHRLNPATAAEEVGMALAAGRPEPTP